MMFLRTNVRFLWLFVALSGSPATFSCLDFEGGVPTPNLEVSDISDRFIQTVMRGDVLRRT